MHVAIVGGGVIGLCAANSCRERGFRVTVIERGSAERDGCSFGNAGMIVPSHVVPLAAPGMTRLAMKWMGNSESPFYVRPRLSLDLLSWGVRFWRSCSRRHVERAAPLLRDLHRASRAEYETLDQLLGHDIGLTRNGLLMLCHTRHGLDEEARAADLARTLGVSADVLDAARTAALQPGVRMDVAGSIYYPGDCHLSPPRLMQALQARLLREGCAFLWESEARGFARRGSRIAAVRTTRGDVAADEFVIAGGSWSARIDREIGLRLPLQAGKGYSLTLTNPPQLPRIGAICTEARVAVTPMGAALRFGGTMELAGLNTSINPARVRGIVKSACRYFPDFRPEHFANVTPWCGLRPCSPDGLPYLGRTCRAENLIVATGHAMLGVSLGPITGKLVGQLIAGEPPEIDLALLSPDRYA